MTGDRRTAPPHGRLSSALYRVAHFGRRRPAPEPEPAAEPESAVPAATADEAAPSATRADENEAVANPPASDHQAGTRPEAEVVDPIARTRAALAEARRQMPGMLGIENEESPAS